MTDLPPWPSPSLSGTKYGRAARRSLLRAQSCSDLFSVPFRLGGSRIRITMFSTTATPARTDLFLFLLLLQDFGDLLLEALELLLPFANHFRRDLPVPHLVLAGGMLYGRLQYLAIGLSNESDRSVKGKSIKNIRSSQEGRCRRTYRPFLPARAVRPTRCRYCASWPGMS